MKKPALPDTNQSVPTQVTELSSTSTPSVSLTASPIVGSLKNYSLVNYSLKQSLVYDQLGKNCLDPYWADAQDTRLIKNDGTVLIPSLIKVISDYNKEAPNCAMSVEIFSAPTDEKFLYLNTFFNSGSDVPYSGVSGIYRLNLSNLSIKNLFVSDFIGNVDLYRGIASDSYQLLSDGKRLVKWNMNGIYLVNLEADSKSTLYTSPKNQWLISKIEFGMGQIADYDVQISGDQIFVGVYDKTKTLNGKAITIDEYGNVRAESQDVQDDIQPMLINHIAVLISD